MRGRPITSNPRSHIVGVRFTDEEHLALLLLAAAEGKTISNYCRDVLLPYALLSEAKASQPA